MWHLLLKGWIANYLQNSTFQANKMDMSLGSESSSLTPLNDSGVDFSNFTQAYNFQQEILDDTILQVIANSYARYFWYGVVVLIGLATIFNIFTKILLQIR